MDTINLGSQSKTNFATQKIGIVELFAGVAGLAQGFFQSGKFDLIALSDIDNNAKEVFKFNFPHVDYIRSDIHDLIPGEILDAADGRHIAGLLGGPPCQGFSLAGKKNPNDARNLYVEDYLRFVHILNPDFILLENVPQMLFHKMFESMKSELSRNYRLEFAIINSASFGVPQTRHRAFILGYNRRLGVHPIFPKPTHGFIDKLIYNYSLKEFATLVKPNTLKEILGADPVISKLPQLITMDIASEKEIFPVVTIHDAINDLSGICSGESASGYPRDSQTEFQEEARISSSGMVLNHTARRHSRKMLELIKIIPEGGDLKDVSEKYWPKSHYSQAYGRLHRNGLARTLTTHFCNPGSGRFIHPTDDRSITVREAARLQGFHDDFEFHGSQSDQMRAVGNAVPIPVAKAIANQIWFDLGEMLS